MIIINVKNFGKIKIELDYVNAKNSAANFVELARNGFYNNLTFHRVIRGFMIQGGDPNGNGTGGPGYAIFGEFKANGYDNKISHERGVISMARAFNPNSASSQFFICHVTSSHLDGKYAAFGKVTDGMDVVDAIAAVETNDSDKPLVDVVINSITFAE